MPEVWVRWFFRCATNVRRGSASPFGDGCEAGGASTGVATFSFLCPIRLRGVFLDAARDCVVASYPFARGTYLWSRTMGGHARLVKMEVTCRVSCDENDSLDFLLFDGGPLHVRWSWHHNHSKQPDSQSVRRDSVQSRTGVRDLKCGWEFHPRLVRRDPGKSLPFGSRLNMRSQCGGNSPGGMIVGPPVTRGMRGVRYRGGLGCPVDPPLHGGCVVCGTVPGADALCIPRSYGGARWAVPWWTRRPCGFPVVRGFLAFRPGRSGGFRRPPCRTGGMPFVLRGLLADRILRRRSVGRTPCDPRPRRG